MKRNKAVLIAVMTVVLVTTFSFMAFAMTEHFTDASRVAGADAWQAWQAKWETIKADLEHVALAPGADQTRVNFCWYSHTATTTPLVKWSTQAEMSNAKTFTGMQCLHRMINGRQYYSSKVTVSGVAANHAYYYQYENNGIWSAPVAYKSKNFSHITILYVGDPQIGASVGRMPSEEHGGAIG